MMAVVPGWHPQLSHGWRDGGPRSGLAARSRRKAEGQGSGPRSEKFEVGKVKYGRGTFHYQTSERWPIALRERAPECRVAER